jgi:hypothetical protein
MLGIPFEHFDLLIVGDGNIPADYAKLRNPAV